MRDPVRRLTKALAARSAIPLVPLIAAVAAWRRHVAAYPAAAPLATELQEIAAEATAELERRQARAAAASLLHFVQFRLSAQCLCCKSDMLNFAASVARGTAQRLWSHC